MRRRVRERLDNLEFQDDPIGQPSARFLLEQPHVDSSDVRLVLFFRPNDTPEPGAQDDLEICLNALLGSLAGYVLMCAIPLPHAARTLSWISARFGAATVSKFSTRPFRVPTSA